MPDTERIIFTVGLPPVALRRNRETAHKGYRAKLIREYQEQCWVAGYGALLSRSQRRWPESWPQPFDRAHLKLTWRHHRAAPDPDNALASCKWLIDVLKATGPRPLGIVIDDSPEHLTVEIAVEKVKTKAEECVLVEVTRLA